MPKKDNKAECVMLEQSLQALQSLTLHQLQERLVEEQLTPLQDQDPLLQEALVELLERGYPAPDCDVEAELDAFLKSNPVPRVKKPLRMKFCQPMTAVVAMILLVVMASATIYHCFQIEMGGQTATVLPSGIITLSGPNREGYQTLNDMLRAYKLPELAPAWIPERFSLSELISPDESTNGQQSVYSAWYTEQGQTDASLCIQITHYPQKIPQSLIASYEKDEGYKKITRENGFDYFLYENLGQTGAIWEVEGYNCIYSITGPVSREEIAQMIKSLPN